MKLVSLISGGFDSPVASYIMAKMGADVILLHMDNGIYGGKGELDKVKTLADRLKEATGKDFPLYVLNHEANQTLIKERCEHPYQCVMCKRTMQHVAKAFALKNGCSGIIMGDSLGQVASQTLRNIKAEGTGLDFPVVRPLIGMDKTEIIEIARKIDTFDTSVLPYEDCCTVFTPRHPATHPKMEKILEGEKHLDEEALIRKALEGTEIIRV